MDRDIDRVIALAREKLPAILVRQHEVVHPGVDDDGIWWFSLPGIQPDVHVESSYGQCPFLIATNEQDCGDAIRTSTIDQTVDFIVTYLTAALAGKAIRIDGERFWN